ncbi:MAG: SPASM domain-containing protein, partial [Nanoarchaeota archaeon]|nr:SPASM domain-containing protein [Nanoarchaeota archaeon]
EIWNNKKYQNFRKRLKSSKRPKECFSCPYYSKTVF